MTAPRLPDNYYHAFLGNGIDAVLIGYTGSMVPDRIHGPDRCYWYKTDRYYPDDIPVVPVLNRRTVLDPAFRPQPGEPWYELAPLGRCWYETGAPVAAEQRFDARRATLTSIVDYPGRRLTVTTFLHAALPVLVERYEADAPGRLRFWCAPGVWTPGPDEVRPYAQARITPGPVPVCSYASGTNVVWLAMLVEPEPIESGGSAEGLWVEVEGRTCTRYVIVLDGREERLPYAPGSDRLDALIRAIRERGYEGLKANHLSAWESYFDGAAAVDMASPALARAYEVTNYQLKASQHPQTGAIPVNNLRPTWSSHVFWDAGFMHLAMLQMGHLREADLGCRFFERLRERAGANARAYGAQGLKYDWETTHDGTPAYGVYRHMIHQVHNNAMYSLMCWHQYRYARDRALLARLYPVIRGIAEFFLTGVVRDGPTIRPVTGIAELAEPVTLDAATLAGTIRALRNAAAAAGILGVDEAFAARCAATAGGLIRLFDTLTGDGVLYATDRRELSWGVLPACSLMEIFAPDDPIVLQTARAFAAENTDPRHGIVGHGAHGRGPQDGFPWVAGWLASVLAAAGAPEDAWRVLRPVERAVSSFGGLPEKVFADGGWNMQHFTTAQAAVCLALHALIVHCVRDTMHVEAPPWDGGRFERIRLDGLEISGAWERGRIVACTLHNGTAETLSHPVQVNDAIQAMTLPPAGTLRVV